MNSTTELILKYQEQNAEITRTNARLNERIAILENVIYELQQDNIQLRIANAVKQRMKKKGVLKKKTNTPNVNITSTKVKSGMNEEKQPATTPPPPPPPLSLPLPPPPPKQEGEEKRQEQQQPRAPNEITSKKRSCSSKPINYILPSTKCKLRKGDPFTFGND